MSCKLCLIHNKVNEYYIDCLNSEFNIFFNSNDKFLNFIIASNVHTTDSFTDYNWSSLMDSINKFLKSNNIEGGKLSFFFNTFQYSKHFHIVLNVNFEDYIHFANKYFPHFANKFSQKHNEILERSSTRNETLEIKES